MIFLSILTLILDVLLVLFYTSLMVHIFVGKMKKTDKNGDPLELFILISIIIPCILGIILATYIVGI